MCSQCALSVQPQPSESREALHVIQLTRHGRLPVAPHYDPIQSARLPASSASHFLCSQKQKRSQTATNHHRFTVSAVHRVDYIFQTREEKRKVHGWLPQRQEMRRLTKEGMKWPYGEHMFLNKPHTGSSRGSGQLKDTVLFQSRTWDHAFSTLTINST